MNSMDKNNSLNRSLEEVMRNLRWYYANVKSIPDTNICTSPEYSIYLKAEWFKLI